MWQCEKSDAHRKTKKWSSEMERMVTHRSAALIYESFALHGDRTTAFIENDKLRFVVEQSSHLQDKAPQSSVFDLHLQQCVAFLHRIEHRSNPEPRRKHLRFGSDRSIKLCRADRAIAHLWCLFDASRHAHRDRSFDRVMFLSSCRVSEECRQTATAGFGQGSTRYWL